MGLLIDVMEPARIAKDLLDIGDVQSLPSADYRWFTIKGELVGIERKSIQDFLGSLSNGSLADELRRLAEDVDIPILLSEGPLDVDHVSGTIYRSYWSGGKFHRRETGWKISSYIPAIYGFCRTFGVFPFYSPSINETAKVIRYLYNYDQETYHTEVFKVRKRDYVIPSPAAVTLSAIVGPKTAHELLSHFGSLRKVLMADRKELITVYGIGPKTADKLISTLDKEYNPATSLFSFEDMLV